MKQNNKGIIENYIRLIGLKKYAYSANTQKQYIKIVKEFEETLDKSLLEVNKRDITIYLDSQDLNVPSFNYKLACLKNLYTVLGDSMLYPELKYNPVSIKRGKSQAKQVNPLSTNKVEALLRVCKNTRDRAILTLMINTGLRVHELCALTLAQYENRNEHNEITLTVTKGSKQALLFLNDACIEAIEIYLQDRKDTNNTLFVSNYGNAMSPSCLNRTWKTLAKRSGVFNQEEVFNLHNHLFRHTLATNLLDNGVAINVVQDVLRHSSISTTQIYAKTNRVSTRDALRGGLI